ncbi:cupin domain-containing protein [Okeania sp. SIO1I7]|uniref:cupin domain-containing protein n=1 Tax=Okeania sp. SIO1I7 TaxID=2607772 RepID=UPI0013FBB923|nr:cupin domain-containing protein [Okeania sp. SIO1I7]NET27013.1 cupin domain-containing protein [Okeania sp. SIO1I7]
MQHLKRPIIRLLAVIFPVVLGALLVFGEPAFADGLRCHEAATTEHCILTPNSKPYNLDLNAGYIIKLRSAQPKDEKSLTDCYNKAIYAEFEFNGTNESQQVEFSETYPIQANWELHFNTPLSGDPANGTGTLKIKDDTECHLEVDVYPNQTLQLFSGLKSTQDQELGNDSDKNESGHFVIARDYYAAVAETNQNNCNDDDDYFNDVQKICYKRLGSLTSITGENFPALGGAAVAQIIIKPNSIRAPHWHLQFAEAGYCYEGIGQVGVIVPSKTIPKADEDITEDNEDFYKEKIVEEIFLKPNEVFLFPEGSQHYLRNIGNEDFKCALFFAEGPPLNGDQLLTISLQNIVGNTPTGVLDSVFAMERSDDDHSLEYTSEQISKSPAQKFSSKKQGPEVIPVVEACSGEPPSIEAPGCPPPPSPDGGNERIRFSPSLYSDLDP